MIDTSSQYGVGPVPYHRHIGSDSPQISYNDLLDKPTTSASIGIFGTGVDGAGTIGANTSLTRDMYYTTLVVDSGFTLYPNGFRIFASTSVTINGIIDTSGGNATSASGTTYGLAGTGVSSGSFQNPGNGMNGGIGATGFQNGGSAVNGNSLYAYNGAGQAGGNGGAGAAHIGPPTTGGGASKGIGTLVTKMDSFLYAETMADALGPLSANGQGGAGGGGGGGQNVNSAATNGGGGGGSGAAGGTIWIASPKIILNSTGTLSVNGGNGGSGADGGSSGSDCGGGGGGGGAGGNGGAIILLYNTFTNNGTISHTAGTGGLKGLGGTGAFGNGTDGGIGVNGVNGTLNEFKMVNIS